MDTFTSDFQPTLTLCNNSKSLISYFSNAILQSIYSLSTYSPHFEIIVEFSYYRIGTWNGEKFYLLVDDLVKYERPFFSFIDESPITCKDLPSDYFVVKKRIKHNQNTLKLNWKTDLIATTSAGWGFRDFHLSIVFCHPSCKACLDKNSEDFCTDCYYNALLINGRCVCNDGFYMRFEETNIPEFRRSICIMCHRTCKTCLGEGEDKCVTCHFGFVKNLNGLCVNSINSKLNFF